jgi:hypothetical protein
VAVAALVGNQEVLAQMHQLEALVVEVLILLDLLLVQLVRQGKEIVAVQGKLTLETHKEVLLVVEDALEQDSQLLEEAL